MFHRTHCLSRRTLLWLAALLCTIGLASVLFYVVTPDTLVQTIGVQNGYLVMLLISLFGGVSVLTSGSYVVTLLALAAGGLDPFLLGIMSGLGASVGDSAFYFLGHYGHHTLQQGKLHHLVHTICEWLDKRPAWVLPPIVYLLASFTPTPNDLMAGTLGLAQRPFAATVIPLVLGNMTLATLIALFGDTVFG